MSFETQYAKVKFLEAEGDICYGEVVHSAKKIFGGEISNKEIEQSGPSAIDTNSITGMFVVYKQDSFVPGGDYHYIQHGHILDVLDENPREPTMVVDGSREFEDKKSADIFVSRQINALVNKNISTPMFNVLNEDGKVIVKRVK